MRRLAMTMEEHASKSSDALHLEYIAQYFASDVEGF